MSDFTKAEIRKIQHAFEEIAGHLERLGHTYTIPWDDAFKYERRQCSNINWAKALMVENFAEGVRNPKGAAELFSIRFGCRTAHIIGAACVERARTHHDRERASIVMQWLVDDLMGACDESKLAQRAARERRFDNVAKGV